MSTWFLDSELSTCLICLSIFKKTMEIISMQLKICGRFNHFGAEKP